MPTTENLWEKQQKQRSPPSGVGIDDDPALHLRAGPLSRLDAYYSAKGQKAASSMLPPAMDSAAPRSSPTLVVIPGIPLGQK
jgi:hypothetical protein